MKIRKIKFKIYDTENGMPSLKIKMKADRGTYISEILMAVRYLGNYARDIYEKHEGKNADFDMLNSILAKAAVSDEFWDRMTGKEKDGSASD